MRWYSARLLFQSSTGETYEDRVVLLSAESRSEAEGKAVRYGESARESYQNARGETITWTLETVLDIYEIQDPARVFADGIEVYATLITPEAATLVRRALSLRFDE
jgi:hypothetical protein